MEKKNSIGQMTVFLGSIAPIIGLGLMIYIGFYNRFWGDDWCYNFDFKTLGIDGAIKTYFMTGPEALRGYANNRYSLTLISGLLYLLGIVGAKVTAALVITSWFIGLYWTLSNIAKISGFASRTAIMAGTATLLYYTLYISPQRFQVLYWTAGIHYSLAIISGIFLFALITSQSVRATRSKLIDYIIIPVAILAGGFSETGNTFLLSCMTLFLVLLWLQKKQRSVWAEKALPTAIIAFVTLLFSLMILVLAPSNATRTEVISAERTSLPMTIFLSLRFAFDFITDSIRSLPMPHLIFLLVFLALPILIGVSSKEKLNGVLRNVILPVLVILIAIWLITAAVQAPSVMFYGAPPDPRGKSLARFVMLAGLAGIAWLLGRELNSRWNNTWVHSIAILAVILSAVYTARTVTRVYAELPAYRLRAELWDARDHVIQTAVLEQQKRVEVSVIDMKGLGVQDIMKSRDMTGDWITACSSKFYGFEAIKAAQP
jgi:hypothetical protein